MSLHRQAPQVTWPDVPEDQAHYHASVALEEVLGWLLDDGYTPEDLREKCEALIEDLAGERA